jgi:hypothetical protein
MLLDILQIYRSSLCPFFNTVVEPREMDPFGEPCRLFTTGDAGFAPGGNRFFTSDFYCLADFGNDKSPPTISACDPFWACRHDAQKGTKRTMPLFFNSPCRKR